MSFDAYRCPNGHVTYPSHTVCPECGEKQEETIDLSDQVGTVITWTENTATPLGIRQPNLLGIVEFDLGETSIRALGQLTGPVESGDNVVPVYCKELGDPSANIRERESQDWDGYRFQPE